MKQLSCLCAALLVCVAPAAAESIPSIPFHTAYTYWDHHWLQWMPSHPRFEAIEASVASRSDGRPYIRVWFTERVPPKRQTFYFDDRGLAAAMRTGESHYAAIDYQILGVAGAPRGLELEFRDAAGAPVRWRIGFPLSVKLDSVHAGLKPQGGHSADQVFLLFVFSPNATTWDGVATIGDRTYGVTPDSAKADGRYYGAAYTSGAHNGIFNYATRSVSPGALDAARISVITDATGSLKSYTHRFGTHDMTVAVTADRYRVSFDGAAPVLRGTVETATGVVTWRPDFPAWARAVVLRSEFRPAGNGAYELTVARSK